MKYLTAVGSNEGAVKKIPIWDGLKKLPVKISQFFMDLDKTILLLYNSG
jgi:hypothetical protein